MKYVGRELKVGDSLVWHSGNLNKLSQLQDDLSYVDKDYISSRGQGLVTNGGGSLSNNYNFSDFIFDSSDSYFCQGSFKDSEYRTMKSSDELIPVNVQDVYRLSLYAKTNPHVGASYYIGISEFDSDGNPILAFHHMYYKNTLTTLAKDLKIGDTKIYLKDSSNWKNSQGAKSYQRSIIFWGYVNKNGYEYPPETYSRYYEEDLWDDGGIDYVNNVITLNKPWSYKNPNNQEGTWLSGTKISNGNSGGNYKYIACDNEIIPDYWYNYTGCIGGVDNTGDNIYTKFSHGTAYIKLLFLNNRDVQGSTVWYSNISFGLDIALKSNLPTKISELENDINYSINGHIHNLQDITDYNQEIVDANFNNLTNAGSYVICGGAVSNAPTSSRFFSLIVLKSTSSLNSYRNYIQQIAIEEDTHDMYIRYKSTSWSVWKKISTSNIYTSASAPSSVNAGDYWYEQI